MNHHPIKWLGGKRKLAPHLAGSIAAELEVTGGDYFEPFLGGAAVALALGDSDIPMRLADANEDLVCFWNEVQDDPKQLCALARVLFQDIREETYYAMRAIDPGSLIRPLRAVRFLYLNRLSRSGQWRENKKGQMNVPYAKGSAKVPEKLDEWIREASKRLQNATIYHEDFRKMIRCAGAGDVVYADPPYDGGFTAYTAAGFGMEDQIDLAAALRAANRRGATVYASNNNTDLVREAYSWASISAVDEFRPINADMENRGPVGCALIYAEGSYV